ncbi:TlpA disulfide reductase family protein [Flavobacterium undicola]|uniref:TlpA disulfide reductase family protein n=1 Tax=Flavobacterium undicola TaxID=1932779 RepID=UPI001377A555|nr:TlpA disulfide reductase family protein [Flavobacterium undicola]MBA0884799.1 redoxin domain-containing protein [Flavobacterium undicola]
MKKIFIILVTLLVSCGVFSQKTIDKPNYGSGKLTKKEAVSNIATVHCKLKGNVIGGNSTYLMLVTEKDDPFHSGTKIPIKEGQFEYNIVSPFSEKYTLILGEELENGTFIPIDFFAENGSVEFVLHTSQEFDKNTISGGKLTDKMVSFEKEQIRIFDPIVKPIKDESHSLMDTNNYFSEAVTTIQEKIKNLKQGEELNKAYRIKEELLETDKGYTIRAWFLKNKMDSIKKLKYNWEAKYIASNQNIFSYSLLLNEVRWYKQNKKNIDINVVNNLFSSYSKKFPLHPYTKQIEDILEAIKTIKVGGMFVDFSAPNFEGQTISASDVVTGKVALIDLWASWCGPCRITSKSYIPIYEKYKEKGLVILGVANEFKNTNAFVKAIEKDKYPWLNLIELDNKNRIWDKYNVSNSGGSTFLIDSNGVIVAIHPDAEELDKILSKLLN